MKFQNPSMHVCVLLWELCFYAGQIQNKFSGSLMYHSSLREDLKMP